MIKMRAYALLKTQGF